MQSTLVQLFLLAQQTGGAETHEAVGLAGLYEKLGWPFFVNIFISIIVLAVILGLVLFGSVPDAVVALGTAIVIGAGLYVLWRRSPSR